MCLKKANLWLFWQSHPVEADLYPETTLRRVRNHRKISNFDVIPVPYRCQRFDQASTNLHRIDYLPCTELTPKCQSHITWISLKNNRNTLHGVSQGIFCFRRIWSNVPMHTNMTGYTVLWWHTIIVRKDTMHHTHIIALPLLTHRRKCFIPMSLFSLLYSFMIHCFSLCQSAVNLH